MTPRRGESVLPPSRSGSYVRPASLVQDGGSPHDKLYTLLDGTSPLKAPAIKVARKGFEIDADGRMVAAGDEDSREEAISKFAKAFRRSTCSSWRGSISVTSRSTPLTTRVSSQTLLQPSTGTPLLWPNTQRLSSGLVTSVTTFP